MLAFIESFIKIDTKLNVVEIVLLSFPVQYFFCKMWKSLKVKINHTIGNIHGLF